VDVIDSLAGLEALVPEWTDLCRRCPRASPFQSPQWLVPWTRHLWGGGEIWTLAIREHGELIGLAPLFRWGYGPYTVSFLGAGVSDYGDLLFAPGREEECVAAVHRLLMDRRDRWDVLDLCEVRSGAGLLELWPGEPCSACPVLDLATYPQSMDRTHRTNIRHMRNRLNRHPNVQFSTGCRVAEFFALYEARWGRLSPALRAFHLEVANGFHREGMLRMALLEVDGAPAASIYAFTTGPTFYCYLTGFDPAMSSISPGALLLQWLIEDAIAEGFKEVDFLRHRDPYKYLWGARDRVSHRITMLRESIIEQVNLLRAAP
jgi:CelD/BcsL family acetyltransferase involved in cellulose biosynthesis